MSYQSENEEVALVVRYHNTETTQTFYCPRRIARKAVWGFISYINHENPEKRVGGGMLADDELEPIVVFNFDAVASMIINEKEN